VGVRGRDGGGDEYPKKLRPLFDAAFADLSASIEADKGRTPKSQEAFEMFIEALQRGDVVRETVNSDRVVMVLLDERAELKLRTPFNIFVGGSILDRGITMSWLALLAGSVKHRPLISAQSSRSERTQV